jgi:predicted O-linked N-acetylglucosamine transferase (SPINDLY family)
MDYILGDTITTPFENEHHFAEKIIQMPHAYFLGSYPDVFPHLLFPEYMKDYTRAAREDWGLPVDKFIFADFNHLRKVTPSVSFFFSYYASLFPLGTNLIYGSYTRFG